MAGLIEFMIRECNQIAVSKYAFDAHCTSASPSHRTVTESWCNKNKMSNKYGYAEYILTFVYKIRAAKRINNKMKYAEKKICNKSNTGESFRLLEIQFWMFECVLGF